MYIDVELHSGSTVLRLLMIAVDETGEQSHMIDEPPHRLVVRTIQSRPLLVVTAVDPAQQQQPARWFQRLDRLSPEWQWLDERWNHTAQHWNCRLRLWSA